MIAYLAGTVMDIEEYSILLKTDHGIGYKIYTQTNYFKLGDFKELYLTQIFREDHQELYGFLNLADKKFFDLLLEVRGVGPKSAYSLISTLSVVDIVRAISFEDKKTLSKAPGIGPKAAAQIILDLANKIKKINVQQIQNTGISKNSGAMSSTQLANTSTELTMLREAVWACKELGFDESKASSLAGQLMAQSQFQKTEDLVRALIKGISL